MVCLFLIKFKKHAKRQEGIQSEEKKKTSVPDSYMMLILELINRKIKITMTNTLRALM